MLWVITFLSCALWFVIFQVQFINYVEVLVPIGLGFCRYDIQTTNKWKYIKWNCHFLFCFVFFKFPFPCPYDICVRIRVCLCLCVCACLGTCLTFFRQTVHCQSWLLTRIILFYRCTAVVILVTLRTPSRMPVFSLISRQQVEGWPCSRHPCVKRSRGIISIQLIILIRNVIWIHMTRMISN